MKRIFQTLFMLALCVGSAWYLGLIYAVIGGLTILFMLVTSFWQQSGLLPRDVIVAIGVGLVWPVLLLAAGVYYGSARLAAQRSNRLSAIAMTGEAGLRGVKDLEHSERRDEGRGEARADPRLLGRYTDN
jgi:hypothetical protein